MYVKVFTTDGVLLDTIESQHENVKVDKDKDQNLTRVRSGNYYSPTRFITEEVVEVYGPATLVIKRKAWNK